MTKSIYKVLLLLIVVVAIACQQENISPLTSANNSASTLTNDRLQANKFSMLSSAWASKAKFISQSREGTFTFANEKKFVGFIGGGMATINNIQTYYNDLWQYSPATNAWTQVASLPGSGRAYSVSFVIGNNAYVGTGHDKINFATSDFFMYDPFANVWQTKASLPIALVVAAGFSDGSLGYIGTGVTSVFNNSTFWEYNPATDAWTQKADFGGGKRYYAIAFSISGKGYMGGGLDDNSITRSDFWTYNQTSDTWTQKNDLPVPGYGTGLAIGLFGYLTSGQQSFWKYSPSTDSWSPAENCGYTVDAFNSRSAFALNGKGYFGLGIQTLNGKPVYIKDFWEYTPN